MIKLFIGGKGSGKTKTLIELVNNATAASNGSVVCIEKGDKLTHDITYKARLIDSDEYGICVADTLYGFIAGVLASNSDITDIFVDGLAKFIGMKIEDMEKIYTELDLLSQDHEVDFTLTVSSGSVPDYMKKYI